MRLHPSLVLEYVNHPTPKYTLKIYKRGDLPTTILLDRFKMEPEEAFRLARHVFDAVCDSYRELQSLLNEE